MSEPVPSVAVIVVAAGSGARLGLGHPKAFVPLCGRPILQWALRGVAGISRPVQLIIVAPADRLAEAETVCAAAIAASGTASGTGSGAAQGAASGAAAIATSIAASGTASGTAAFRAADIVAGGLTRQASVAAGLAKLGAGIRTVLVHDAARALTPTASFDRVILAVERGGCGAVPGLAVVDTVKRIDAHGDIAATVDRSDLSAVQTPQGFPREQLDEAYAAAAAAEPTTDDAALVAAIGHPVTVIDGDPLAFKITTPADLSRAERELTAGAGAQHSGGRIGIGTDTHAFDPDAPLWLAGLYWPGEPGLAGHSDGDAVAHAITDALLSAAGLGDIGSVFGTADPQFARAHGEVFLVETRRRVEAAGYRIGNVSVQLIGTRPRFASRRSEAQDLLTGLLGAPVTVSATTTDGLGFTGRGEGIAAIATALLHGHPEQP